MDGIQPYVAPAPHRPVAVATPAPNPAAVKTPSDYIRALRRRVWLVFMVGVPLSVLATISAVRQPAIYMAKTQIMIEPPKFDPAVATMVSPELGRNDADSNDRYLPNLVAQLKSKAIAEEVVNDPAFLQGAVPNPDAADELVANLQARIVTGTNWVTLSLEGTDPARTAKQLAALIEVFSRRIKLEASAKNESPKSFATDSLTTLNRELKEIETQIQDLLLKTKTIGPGGTNIYQKRYENMESFLSYQRTQINEFQRQSWMSKSFAKDAAIHPGDARRLDKIESLQEMRRTMASKLRDRASKIRNPDSDPSVKELAGRLKDVIENIERLEAVPMRTSLDPSESILGTMQQDLAAAEETSKQLLKDLRDSMPEHEYFLSKKEEHTEKLKEIAEMKKKLSTLKALGQYQNSPVQDTGPVTEPTAPVRPRRSMNIAIGILMSFGLGIALVCVLEHLDHSVKVPEHLTVGLTLPLLGVVPRIRRTALTHRGGHLWTPGAPDSVEADAYRNLRASLLGASDRLGPIATLLVTSAKAGEGKSTTALNLAATCARAGERTLLIDVDLRRPSLAEVFADGSTHEHGLVDVLRGTLPWQRTLVRTDIPNLDFLPTGDTRDIPIEVLGALELRQLLIGLANHYDRVILDGPAVLGLADCRMLGRIVDAAVLVVRSGTHELRPLQRAKVMLEQSGVVLAGVIFNGLYEDLQNWSSYGPYQADAFSDRPSGPRGGLDGPDDAHAALPLAGAAAG